MVMLTNILKRHHENRRISSILEIFARATEAKASGTWALHAGHNLESHKPVQWRLESEGWSSEEVAPTAKTRWEFRMVNVLEVLILIQVHSRLLGSRAALLGGSFPFRSCWHG